jgi:hypothetical protein
MNKKLLAASIAGVIAVPLTASAGEHRFSGELRGSVSHVDDDFPRGREGESFNNNDSRVDLQGSHGPGIYHIQVGIRTDDENRTENIGGATYLRQAYAGLKGMYGTLTVGRRSADYKWYGAEEWDPFWDTSRAGFDGRFTVAGPGYGASELTDPFVDNSIAYLTPVVPVGFGTLQANAGVYLDDTNEDEHSYGAGLRYKASAFVAGAQYLDFGNPSGEEIAEDANGNGVLDETDFKSRFEGNRGFRRAYKGYAGVNGKNFLVAGSYEHLDGEEGFREDRDYYYALAKYNVTPSTYLAGSYGMVDDDEDTDNLDPQEGLVDIGGDGHTLGVFHQLYEKTTVYGLYSKASLDNDADTDVVSVGLNQGFEFGQ